MTPSTSPGKSRSTHCGRCPSLTRTRIRSRRGVTSPMRPDQSIEGEFPTATEGLPEAQPSARVELVDGDEVTLDIAPVTKNIAGTTVRMLAYNGSVPGPTLVAPQDATITVHVTN